MCRSGPEAGKKSAESNRGEIVHFSWQRGMVLNSRYKAVRLLGDGTFGRVLLAQDTRDGGREVAVKVIREVKRRPDARGGGGPGAQLGNAGSGAAIPTGLDLGGRTGEGRLERGLDSFIDRSATIGSNFPGIPKATKPTNNER